MNMSLERKKWNEEGGPDWNIKKYALSLISKPSFSPMPEAIRREI